MHNMFFDTFMRAVWDVKHKTKKGEEIIRQTITSKLNSQSYYFLIYMQMLFLLARTSAGSYDVCAAGLLQVRREASGWKRCFEMCRNDLVCCELFLG